MKAMTWVYWPWYGENNQANQSKNTIACNGSPFSLLVFILYFKLKMQTSQVKTIWSIRDFFCSANTSTNTSTFRQFWLQHCILIDLKVTSVWNRRYVEEQKLCHAVMHQCAGILEQKPNGLNFRLHGSMAHIANTLFHQKRHSSNNTCNSNHFM